MSRSLLAFAAAALMSPAGASIAIAGPTQVQSGAVTQYGAPLVNNPGYPRACDAITGGCAAAHSVSQQLVAAYTGPLFELINTTPAWTGTGYVSGTRLTISSTSTGTIANGLALSAAGSGVTPAFKPVTYTSGCSVSGCAVNIPQTAGSPGTPLTISAYRVLDVGFYNDGAWDESTWQSFCYGATCLVEKIFNQGSGGSADDLIASQISAGSATNLNCTASIIVCAPLFVIDTSTDTPMAITVSSEMGLFADSYVGNSSAGMPAAGANAAVMFSGLNAYASACCGGLYGLTENNPNSITLGGMLAIGFANGTGSGGPVNCQASNLVCFLADDEGGGDPSSGPWQVYDSGALDRGVWEIKYTSSTNTASGSYNGTNLYSVSPPARPASKRQTWLRIGAGGDRSWLPEAFSDGLITADVSVHTSVYNKLYAFYAGRSSSTCQGPLDLGWYMPKMGLGETGGGIAAAPLTVGNGLGGWGTRPLSAWYTGPIINVTNNAGSTQTFAAVGCTIDPAITAFCSGSNAPCLVNTLYTQAWTTANARYANVRQPGNDMTASGSNRPTLTLNSLGGRPTIHFAGSQQLCTGTPIGGVKGIYPIDLAVVARRTGGTSSLSYAFASNAPLNLGFAASPNTASFAFGATTTAAANDNAWHELDLHGIGSTGGTAYVDGRGTSANFTTSPDFPAYYCLGGHGNNLTGDIAEAVMTYNALFTGGPANNAAPILANDQAFYGVTFPH